MTSAIRPLDRERLRAQYRDAEPFPFFAVDGFLDEDLARSVANAYPSYELARTMGHEFNALNERLKIQVTDRTQFPESVEVLADALESREFLEELEYITGIDNLLADSQLAGGGMHLSGPGGRLDVHVDFNYIRERELHRRLNILLYLNKDWEASWGGAIELWDSKVSRCVQSFAPVFNRCVVFETSDISFHGVKPISCPPDQLRRSFAAYYYTREAPVGWDGTEHSTIFRARPTEQVRGRLLMPANAVRERARQRWRSVKQRVKSLLP